MTNSPHYIPSKLVIFRVLRPFHLCWSLDLLQFRSRYTESFRSVSFRDAWCRRPCRDRRLHPGRVSYWLSMEVYYASRQPSATESTCWSTLLQQRCTTRFTTRRQAFYYYPQKFAFRPEVLDVWWVFGSIELGDKKLVRSSVTELCGGAFEVENIVIVDSQCCIGSARPGIRRTFGNMATGPPTFALHKCVIQDEPIVSLQISKFNPSYDSSIL